MEIQKHKTYDNEPFGIPRMQPFGYSARGFENKTFVAFTL